MWESIKYQKDRTYWILHLLMLLNTKKENRFAKQNIHTEKKRKALVSSAVAKSREKEDTSGYQKTKLAESLLAMIASMIGKMAGQSTICVSDATEENDTMAKAMVTVGIL